MEEEEGLSRAAASRAAFSERMEEEEGLSVAAPSFRIAVFSERAEDEEGLSVAGPSFREEDASLSLSSLPRGA